MRGIGFFALGCLVALSVPADAGNARLRQRVQRLEAEVDQLRSETHVSVSNLAGDIDHHSAQITNINSRLDIFAQWMELVNDKTQGLNTDGTYSRTIPSWQVESPFDFCAEQPAFFTDDLVLAC